MKRAGRSKPKKRWLKTPLLIVVIFALGVGAYGFSVYNNAKKTVNDKMHEPVESIDLKKTKKKVKKTASLNILLMGIDSEKGEKGRSDALMILTLNPDSDQMQIISIPRDTRTNIAGTDKEDKINHAYALGGPETAVATVEDFLGIDLDYYVRMNMSGMKELVDELGSISVQNDIEWNDGEHYFKKGNITLNSEETMAYVRMRKQDPDGDFGRTKRQRQVIQGIINEGASIGSMTKVSSMIDIFGKNMGTNIDFEDMKKLFRSYRDTRKNITEYMMQGNGQTIGGIYYMMVTDEEVDKVHAMINEIQ